MYYQVKFNPDTLIDNFLINAYALENYFQIDILDELDSIARKIGATTEVKDRLEELEANND